MHTRVMHICLTLTIAGVSHAATTSVPAKQKEVVRYRTPDRSFLYNFKNHRYEQKNITSMHLCDDASMIAYAIDNPIRSSTAVFSCTEHGFWGTELPDSAHVAWITHEKILTFGQNGISTMLAKDLAQNEPAPHTPPANISAVCVDAQNKRLLTSSINGTITAWAINEAGNPLVEGQFIAQLPGVVRALAMMRNGYLVCGYKNQVHLRDRENNAVHTYTQPTSLVQALCVLGQHLAVTGHGDGTFYLWDHAALREKCAINSRSQCVRSVACLQPETLFVSGSDDATARVWDVRNPQKAAQTFYHASKVLAVDAHQDANSNLIATADTLIHTWDLRNAVS